jgi:hypothetical protein
MVTLELKTAVLRKGSHAAPRLAALSHTGGSYARLVVLRKVVELSLALCVVWAVITGGQLVAGDLDREFAANADEASHFVTGLMIRDYLAGGRLEHPVAFAERFYLSYPKVGFGIWPPLFHVIEGPWMLAFPASRTGIMLLMGLLAAFLVTIIYAWAAYQFGRTIAILASIFVLASPGLRHSVSFVNLDVLCALLLTASALCVQRYLESEDWRYSAAFGVLAGLALLTKYNALAAALVPPIAALLSARARLMLRPTFWLPVPVVLAIAGPWYASFWDNVLYAAAPGPAGHPDLVVALHGNLDVLSFGAGYVGAAAALTGFALLAFRREFCSFWGCLCALTISVVAFHSLFYPIVEVRYIVAGLAPLSLAAAWGIDRLCTTAGRRARLVMAASVACIVFGGLWQSGQRPMVSSPSGFQDAARVASDLLQARKRDVVLVSSGAHGEGAFIAELALRDDRPHTFVLRGSKMLSTSTWMRDEYRSIYASTQEVEDRLDELRVAVVVTDRDPGNLPHQRLLASTLAGSPRWRPRSVASPYVVAFERVADFERPIQPIQVDLRYTLGRSLSATRPDVLRESTDPAAIEGAVPVVLDTDGRPGARR